MHRTTAAFAGFVCIVILSLLCISSTNYSLIEPTIFLDKVSTPFQKSFISDDPIPLSKTTFVGYDPDGYIDDFAYIAAVPTSTFVHDGNQYISPLIHSTGSNSENWLVEDWTDYLSLDGGMKQVVLIGDFSATQIIPYNNRIHICRNCCKISLSGMANLRCSSICISSGHL
jgi:hypothetical protein